MISGGERDCGMLTAFPGNWLYHVHWWTEDDTAIPSVFECWKGIPHIYTPVKERKPMERPVIPPSKVYLPLSDMTKGDNQTADHVVDPEDLQAQIASQSKMIARLREDLTRARKEISVLQKTNATLEGMKKYLSEEQKKLQSEIDRSESTYWSII